VLFVLAFLVGLARILAGVHNFVDILGSIAIAFFMTYFVFEYILPKVWQRFSKKYPRFISE
jgi:membrane-associated phospholipid phosphatase